MSDEQGRHGSVSARRFPHGGLLVLPVLLLVAVVPLLTSNLTATGLFELPLTYDQTGLPKAVAVLLLTWTGLLSWSASHASRSGWRWPVGFSLLIAVLASFTVSALTSISPMHSLFGWYTRYEGLLMYLTYGGLYFLVVQVVRREHLVALARTVAYVGAVVAAYGIAQAAGWDPTNWLSLTFESTRSFATYGNPDFLGDYLIFPLAFAVALVIAEKTRARRALAAAAGLLCLVAEIGTLARGGWIGTFVTLAIMMIAERRRPVVRRLVAFLAVVVILVTLALTLSSPLNPVSRLESLIRGTDAGVTGRVEVWRAAVQAFTDRPVLGSGLGTFALAARPYYDETAQGRADNAHDYPLQLLVTTGLVGCALLLAFFCVVLLRSRRAALAVDDAAHSSPVYLAAWAAAVGYLVALIVGLSLPGNSAFLWLSLGLVAGPISRSRAPLSRATRTAAAAVLAIALLGCAYVSYRAIAADHVFMRARHAARSGEPYAHLVREAVRLNPVPERYHTELSLAEFLEKR